MQTILTSRKLPNVKTLKYSRFFLIFWSLVFFSGCKLAPVVDQLVKEPSVSITQFSLIESSLMKQGFVVELNIENPNVFSLPLAGVDYGLSIANVPVASGVTQANTVIPAGGEGKIKLEISTNLLKSLPELGGILLQGQRQLSYEVGGQVKLDNSLIPMVPFQKSGAFQLKL